MLGALGAAAGVVIGAALAVAAAPAVGAPRRRRDDGAGRSGRGRSPARRSSACSPASPPRSCPPIGAGRMRPVDALAERFRATAARGAAPPGWAALLAAGAACGLVGDRLLADDFADYTRRSRVAETGGYVEPPGAGAPRGADRRRRDAAGRRARAAHAGAHRPARAAGPRLPVAARLAVRDAARHRHRTGPATSAIAVAVAGSVVLAFLVAGSVPGRRAAQRAGAAGARDRGRPGRRRPAAARAGAAEAAAELPGARVLVLREPLRALTKGEAPAGHPARAAARAVPVPRSGRLRQRLPVTGPWPWPATTSSTGGVAEARSTRDARRALAAGKVVMFDATPSAATAPSRSRPRGTAAPCACPRMWPNAARLHVPAVRPRAARGRARAGLGHRDGPLLVTYDAGATRDDVDAAFDAVDRSARRVRRRAAPARRRGPDARHRRHRRRS